MTDLFEAEPAPDKLRRLFFALVPPEAVRDQLERDTGLLARNSGGRVIPARNFHVTLLFIGDVLPSLVPAVLAAADETTSPVFTLALNRIDAWPGSAVLVLTGDDIPTALVALVEGLRFNLLNRQIKLKREIYRPHITLVRKLPRLQPAAPFEVVEWAVQEFVLIDSLVTHSGSEYRVLGRWPLA